MTMIKVGFAGGTTLLDKAIQKISGGDYADITHAYIYLLDSIVEAEGVKEYSDPYPGVWVHPADKYDSSEHVKEFYIDVPYIESARSKARDLIGTLYGYIDCIGTAAALAGMGVPVDDEQTVMCSETVVRILRAGGIDVIPGKDADLISPIALYEWIVSNGGIPA